MKARIKATGEIVNVIRPPYESIYYKADDKSIRFKRTELEFINDSIDWEERRFELVKAAMQGTSLYSKIKIYQKETISKFVIELADAVLAEYRKGENNERTNDL